jgi:CRISPR/Cas system-associated exonuclease Cas4 (RecB family)
VLLHEMLREFATRLRARDGFPLSSRTYAAAEAELEDTIKQVAAKYEEQLAPLIARVWQDGVAELHADLRDWLKRAVQDPTWVPAYFELGFGRVDPQLDAASRTEPVVLDCGLRLRGAIDLVERRDDELRAVDYKSGQAPRPIGAIGGGRMLQPLLYALVLEKLFPELNVAGGQAYYCTARGEYRRIEVALGSRATHAAELVAHTIGDALAHGFLPAAPDKGACEYCDFASVCGPYEEQRIARKEGRLERLFQLRREA